MKKPVGWGIIGPGSIAQNFATGLAECNSGELVAVCGRTASRRDAFADRFGLASDRRFDDIDALLADGEVEAVYLSTPHPFHAEIAIRTMRAGKHVLVEKPAGLIPGEVTSLVEVARQTGVFLMEGFMYRCHPQIARMVEIISAGEIGNITHIEASFGFASGYDPASRLDDPKLGGGAILDVGIYPLSLAVLLAGSKIVRVEGVGQTNALGADETARALVQFENGVTASCATSIRQALPNTVIVEGESGQIVLNDPWVPGRNAGPSTARLSVRSGGQTREEEHGDGRMLFAYEAEAASSAIRDGLVQPPSPAAGWAESIAIAEAAAAWRAAVGYRLPAETPEGLRRLPSLLPAGLPTIPRRPITGMAGEISSLIMGCDNKNTLGEAAVIWDAWWEAGGNGFDTGFVYGGGLHETLLGQWMQARGVAQEAKVIVKGAHSPYCLPDVIRTQLEISLDRLQLDHAPIYIMHRDNLDVPVAEFMDALNECHRDGLVGAIGGSNWTIARLAEANAYAQGAGQPQMSVLNNNLSLAVMERPIWPGCLTSNAPDALEFLRQNDFAHVSWSSQARGFFLARGEGTELPVDTTPDLCFGSDANNERRRRAEVLAREAGVAPHNIATAWVLGQSFPSLAIIGPRTVEEIVTTLPAINARLSPQDLAWANLELDSREGG